ncbi:MAG: glycosyltransferase family 9 protein [Candidatus Eisenbacteria bacterium]
MAFRKRTPVELPNRPRILVMETGLIGELLVITPALRAIGKARPEADVTVMVRPGSAPVLIGSPYVKKLLPLVGKERKGFLGVMRLASWVRSRDFDAALVLHTSFRSALIALMGAVPVRAGLSCEGRGFLLTHKRPRDRNAYEVDEHLGVLELLGVPGDGPEMDLFLTTKERRSALSLLRRVAEPRTLVGLHPGASRVNRRWPLWLFVELASRLERDAGVTPVFFFGPREEDLAQGVTELRAMDGKDPPVMLRPGNIRLLAAAFELMDVVVTNNTGPMHVAAAVGTPGVFINGPTPVGRWHPPGALNTPVFSRGVGCRPCDLPQCRIERLACMEEVSVDSVLEAVQNHLSRGESSTLPPGGGVPRR